MGLDASARRVATRGILRSLMAVVPPDGSITVVGYPDTEENALVAALALAKDASAAVRLLAHEPATAQLALTTVARQLSIDARADLIQIRKRSTRSDAWAVIRSGAVLYTHGLASSPRPLGRRLHVNLWHGQGPKRSNIRKIRQVSGAQALAGTAGPWLRQLARDLDMRDCEYLPGNVREQLLHAPATKPQLTSLGLQAPFVLWMPTFREERQGRSGDDADGLPMSSPRSREVIETVAAACATAPVQVVVKPHPSDTFPWETCGLRCISDQELRDAGVPLYSFMGAAHGMISDYSSAWVEYLQLHRPLLLVAPDLAEYRHSRGLNAPAFDLLMESELDTEAEHVADFLNRVGRGERAPHDTVMASLEISERRNVMSDFSREFWALSAKHRSKATARATKRGNGDVRSKLNRRDNPSEAGE